MNVGENKKRRLNRALQRFAAMLIEEASDLSGLPKSKLAEAMGLSDDQVKRYIRLPGMKNSRAPQAAAVQQLENRVAKLLKRSAHTVVVENNTKLGGSDAYFSEGVEGRPGDDLNLREFDLGSFQLGYEGDWPTYRRLKTHQAWATGSVKVKSLIKNRVAFERWPEMLRSYAWQGYLMGARCSLAVTRGFWGCRGRPARDISAGIDRQGETGPKGGCRRRWFLARSETRSCLGAGVDIW